MQRELAAHYRLLASAYHRYVDADLQLQAALNEMQSYFPAGTAPYWGTLGARRSPIRRLHEERDEALLRLQSAYVKFKTARTRAHQRLASRRITLLLSFLDE